MIKGIAVIAFFLIALIGVLSWLMYISKGKSKKVTSKVKPNEFMGLKLINPTGMHPAAGAAIASANIKIMQRRKEQVQNARIKKLEKEVEQLKTNKNIKNLE